MDLEPDLIQNATTDELARAYVAVMNCHFASLAYELNYPKAPAPHELTSRKDYRYLSSVIGDSQSTTEATEIIESCLRAAHFGVMRAISFNARRISLYAGQIPLNDGTHIRDTQFAIPPVGSVIK
jgi:hypothetical protein